MYISIHTYIHTYIYIYIYIYIYTHTHTHTHWARGSHRYTCTCICMFVQSYVFYTYVCVYTHIHIYTHIMHTCMHAYIQERNILGVLAVVSWLKVFRYITITSRLERLFLTMARAVPDLLTYAFLFGLWIFAFSVSGILIFGNEVSYVCICIPDVCMYVCMYVCTYMPFCSACGFLLSRYLVFLYLEMRSVMYVYVYYISKISSS